MVVDEIVFNALYLGVPLAIFLLMVGLSRITKRKQVRLGFLIFGMIGAGAYLIWFGVEVFPVTLRVYTAESCEVGTTTYHLPFGDGVQVDYDEKPEKDFHIWIAIENRTDTPLVIEETIYSADHGTRYAVSNYDGYIIPAGQTHGLTISSINFYFLEPTPKRIDSRVQLETRHSVQCAS